MDDILRLKITGGMTAMETKIEDLATGRVLPCSKVTWSMDLTGGVNARKVRATCEVLIAEFETQGDFYLVHERTYRLGEKDADAAV